MSELKAGMQGTWRDGAFICTFVAGPDVDGWYVVANPRGEYQTVMDFVPDPTPPSTVKVEMSVEDAKAMTEPNYGWVLDGIAQRLAGACATALRAEGLET